MCEPVSSGPEVTLRSQLLISIPILFSPSFAEKACGRKCKLYILMQPWGAYIQISWPYCQAVGHCMTRLPTTLLTPSLSFLVFSPVWKHFWLWFPVHDCWFILWIPALSVVSVSSTDARKPPEATYQDFFFPTFSSLNNSFKNSLLWLLVFQWNSW